MADNQTICKACEEDTTELVNYTLTSTTGEQIVVCDSCYQEISILAKENNKWVEYVEIDNVKYYNLNNN